MRSTKEVKEIAIALAEGKLFSNLHINESNYNRMVRVFMPLMFLDEKQRQDLVDEKMVFAYEYLSKAGPGTINGMPTFTSMNFLNEQDYKKMWAEYTQYTKMREDFMESPVIPFETGDDFLSKNK